MVKDGDKVAAGWNGKEYSFTDKGLLMGALLAINDFFYLFDPIDNLIACDLPDFIIAFCLRCC